MSGSIFEDVRKFEQKLGLPKDFYRRLLGEDDWSFVIKLNALFEGAATHVLSTRLHAPKLIDAFAHLDLLNNKVGKVALLRQLDAITSEQANLMRQLGELRNELAHNVHNAMFSFSEYVASRDANQLAKLVKSFGHGLQEIIAIGDLKISREQFVRENPKVALWITSAEVIACLHLEFEVAALHVNQIALSEYQRLIQDANALKPEGSRE
jgi:hypothetical protein